MLTLKVKGESWSEVCGYATVTATLKKDGRAPDFISVEYGANESDDATVLINPTQASDEETHFVVIKQIGSEGDEGKETEIEVRVVDCESKHWNSIAEIPSMI